MRQRILHTFKTGNTICFSYIVLTHIKYIRKKISKRLYIPESTIIVTLKMKQLCVCVCVCVCEWVKIVCELYEIVSIKIKLWGV